MKNSITQFKKDINDDEIRKQIEVKIQNIRDNFEDRFENNRKVFSFKLKFSLKGNYECNGYL